MMTRWIAAEPRRLAYVVAVPIDELRRKLADVVTDKIHLLAPYDPSILFQGKVGKNEFRLNRVIKRNVTLQPSNSFQPIALGTFEQVSEGTKVDIRFEANPIAKAFGIWWHIFCVPPLLMVVLLTFSEGRLPPRSVNSLLFWSGLIAGFWLLLLFGMNWGIRDFRPKFDQIFTEGPSQDQSSGR